jgi:hypothetical protein
MTPQAPLPADNPPPAPPARRLINTNSGITSRENIIDLITGIDEGVVDLIKFVPGRKRQQDKLPYDMTPIASEDRSCRLCGPPFDDIAVSNLTGEPVCSFACCKRFVVEAIGKPHGFAVKHGKSVINTNLTHDGIFVRDVLLTLRSISDFGSPL